MSDTQDPLVVLQRRMQQRQILAMMGINQWVQPSSKTTHIADISAPTLSVSPLSEPISADSSLTSTTIQSLDIARQSLGESSLGKPIAESPAANVAHSNIENSEGISEITSDEYSINHYYDDAPEPNLSYPDQQSPVTYSFDSTDSKPSNTAVTPLVDTIVQQTAVFNIDDTDSFKGDGLKKESFNRVMPFDLQGGRYGDWVVVVDIQALNHDSQKLWQNITQALSMTCETTSFPICEGMDSAELASASFAGYVFKIGRSEEVKVAALTKLPEGLEHPKLTNLPTLSDMLADSSLKRQFWEQLSNRR